MAFTGTENRELDLVFLLNMSAIGQNGGTQFSHWQILRDAPTFNDIAFTFVVFTAVVI